MGRKSNKKALVSAQKEYNKLVLTWGREVANEIFLKKARMDTLIQPKPSVPSKKSGRKLDAMDAHWARASGTFEGGRKN